MEVFVRQMKWLEKGKRHKCASKLLVVERLQSSRFCWGGTHCYLNYLLQSCSSFSSAKSKNLHAGKPIDLLRQIRTHNKGWVHGWRRKRRLESYRVGDNNSGWPRGSGIQLSETSTAPVRPCYWPVLCSLAARPLGTHIRPEGLRRSTDAFTWRKPSVILFAGYFRSLVVSAWSPRPPWFLSFAETARHDIS